MKCALSCAIAIFLAQPPEAMKVRHPSKYPRLKHVKGQMFSCGMFGVCSDVVLSPSTPPSTVLQFHSSPSLTTTTTCSCGEDKENRALDELRQMVLEKQERLQVNRQFQRVPSSTQWELALKRHRSMKSRYSGLIDLDSSPLQTSELASSEDSASTEGQFSQPQDLAYFVEEVRSKRYSIATLKRLRYLANECEENRNLMIDMGLHKELVALLASDQGNDLDNSAEVLEEAFAVIVVLASDDRVRRIAAEAPTFSVVEQFLRTGSTGCRIDAALLLVKLAENEELLCSIGNHLGILDAVVALLHEREERVVKAAIKGLLALCLSKENRAAAARAGAVVSLLEILAESRGATAEGCLATMELLCTTCDGRAAIIEHAALAIPWLITTILRVSDRGTEYAAGVLCSICTPDNPEALEVAFQARASTHLLLLMQSHCTERARRKALKLLKVLHSYGEKKIFTAECDIQNTIRH